MSGRIGPVAVAATMAFTVATAEPQPLEFHRVHVPAGRLADVPLGGDRYVPMPLADFDAAVARARAAADGADAAEPIAPVAAARWRVALDASGGLVGTVSCTIDAATAGPGRVLPLGGLAVRRAVLGGDPPREATVCGVGDALALVIPQAGTYEMDVRCAATAAGGAAFRLPLVPALATTLEIDLPVGLRPVLAGPAARRAIVAAPVDDAGPWRIEVGPAAELGIGVEPRDGAAPAVALWADVALGRAQATLAATIVPAAPWRQGRLVLDQDPEVRVTDVRAAGDDEPLDHETASDGRALTVTLPRWLDGTRTPLEIRGVVPATGAVWRLPLVRAASAATWAGGGSVVSVDPDFAIREVALDECRVVSPETSAAWPLPGGRAGPAAGAAVYHVEQQAPGATLAVTIGPRTTSFDVRRVTTVEITPNAVLGRVSCDVRVTGGKAFEIAGRVAPGWIIDAVDAVDWSAVTEDGDGPARTATTADTGVDWRIVPSPVGDTLRIGLACAADRERGIGLRITGHRAGLPPGAAFSTADIDMVRLEGEAADAAVIDLRTGADAFVEIGGRPAGWFDVDGRLASLVEDGKARGRIRGGALSPAVEARIVRRRPPLDVDVDVRLEPRDDSLVQTFTFDCRSEIGVESLVVDFAAPGGDGLAWRVESPAGCVATARPLEPSEGGLASRSDAVAASWLVDLSPAPSGRVVLRATRTVPFTEAVPVPLAWVEGGMEPGGTVVVAAAAGARPRLVNRRLRELPTDPGPDGAAMEFAYDAPLAGAAAELVPAAPGSDARAWAWRETVSCWCDESGAIETESRFDLENEGRGMVALSLAPGRRLEAVFVGGVAVHGVEFGPAGGTWQIPLPPARRRTDVVVRTLAAGRPGRGAWRVDPFACGLDVPVLDRDVRLLLPPDLVIVAAGADVAEGPRMPWAARLFGIGVEEPADAGAATGYRSVNVSRRRDRQAGVLVVQRRLLSGAAIVAALVAGMACFFNGRRNAAPACLAAAAAGFAALWVSPVFVPVARAAWWGALAGLALAVRRGPAGAPSSWPRRARAAAAACVIAALVMPRPAAAADAGLRVFVTPGTGGETALVPEPLFRALATFATPRSAAVRTLACRIDADGPQWRLAIDIDADAGGALVLDAGPGAAWLPPAPTAGVAVAGREARFVAAAAGRATIELRLAPAVERRGPIETLTASIPVTPATTVQVTAGDVAAGTLACERATGAGPFVAAPVVAGRFDVSVAGRVRLVRPVDPRDRLAAAIRVADTVNEVAWDRDGCRVDATLAIDAGNELVRSFVVRADPRLERIEALGSDAAPRLDPLGGGRLLVELSDAVRGRARVRIAGRMPLADPVGAREVPGIWLDGVAAETRTIEFAADAEFDALLDPPPPAGATAADLAGRPPVQALVRRRRALVRGTQSLAVSFTPAGVGLALEAQIDAAGTALARIPIDVPVGSAVDRVTLVADDPSHAGAREAVDIEWSRVAADRVLAIVQQPQPGRFRLEVDARLERRPMPQGRLPLVRARLGIATPLLVNVTVEPPLVVTVEGAADAARADLIEVHDGAAEPVYTLTVSSDESETAPSPALPLADDGAANRVEWAEVRASFDERGRVHGLARFDVVARTTVVRLRLPPGMRLFDVLVDGRVAAAEPRAADAWDVPLGEAAWPRTILAVFAGDAAAVPTDGLPLALAPPWLEGFAAAEVVWELRPPSGFELKLAPPCRLLDAAEVAAARSAAADRVATACGRIAAVASGVERDRLEALTTLRRQARGPAAEMSWLNAAGRTDSAAVGRVFAAASEPLVIRAVPAPDATEPARAMATVALVTAAGLAWTASARRRAARRH